MDWVDFHCGHDVETCLLEAQAQAPGSRKQVDSYRSCHRELLPSNIAYRVWGELSIGFFRAAPETLPTASQT